MITLSDASDTLSLERTLCTYETSTMPLLASFSYLSTVGVSC